MALKDESPGAAQLASEAERQELLRELDGWSVVTEDMPKLEKRYSFPDYAAALNFVNKVSEVAEQHDHHPQITFTWGSATVRWWSHSLGGLSRNDFIMAAKTDAVG